ncbi:MAG: phosphoserine phosphatase SerB [Alphaproteobacteria bacterium]
MTNVLTVISDPRGPGIDDNTIGGARAALAGLGADPDDATDWLAPGVACDLGFARGDRAAIQTAVRARLADARVDVVAQPRAGRRKKLLVADMESTIIANEMVDELAAVAGVGAKVAAITDRVVRGELEFAAALAERVAMLAGLPADTLDRLCARIVVMPGARALVQTMRAHGATTALVSGGFTCFSGRVRRALGFDSDYANRLEIEDSRLTGRVRRPILDRAGKRARLVALATKLGLTETETMAVGDGANDLAMLAAAGMGVAFRAKPVVAESARARIDHGDLTALLYIQGYRARDIRE